MLPRSSQWRMQLPFQETKYSSCSFHLRFNIPDDMPYHSQTSWYRFSCLMQHASCSNRVTWVWSVWCCQGALCFAQGWHSSELREREYTLYEARYIYAKRTKSAQFPAKENDKLVVNRYSKIMQRYAQTMIRAFAIWLHSLSFHWGCEMDVAMKVCCVVWYKGIPIGIGRASW